MAAEASDVRPPLPEERRTMKKIPSTGQDRKLADTVPDDEPGKEIETDYDRLLKGPMSERMKPLVQGDSDRCCYGE